MKLFDRNATALLLNKITTLVQNKQHSSWRCIYINLSDSQGRYRQTMYKHFVVNAVTGLLEDEDGFVYRCEDGDIFILFKGALKPIISLLGVHFAGIKPRQLGEQPEDARFTIFDLSKYWNVLHKLCEAKYLQTQVGEDMPGHFVHTQAATRALEAMQE